MRRLRVVSVGLGPIGQRAARLALRRPFLDVVGAVDVDPDKIGRDLAELLGLAEPTGILVEVDEARALDRLGPDAILHCTSSRLPDVKQQVLEACRRGVTVVSSTEELLFPELRHPEIAREIHEAALQGSATVVGTGVNPGFVLDYLVAVASGVSSAVREVRALREVDAATRRLPLQRKVGAGLPVAEFEALARAGRMGHVGMRESVALVGRALDLALDDVRETLEPVVAPKATRTEHIMVPAGHVAGVHDVGLGLRDGVTVVDLDLRMFVGAPRPRDEIHLLGDPDLDLVIAGGVPGDQATAAVLVNTLPRAFAASAGLKTVLDLPPPRLGGQGR